jgi:hypothetical protein
MPLQFVIELVSFGTVFYLVLAGEKQRRRIFVAAASSMYEAVVFLRGLRTGIATVVRRQAVTTCRSISRLGRSLAVLLIALVSMLPNASAQDPCGQCVSADPFQPLKFFLLASLYGLAIWVFLTPKTKEFRSSIYQSLVLVRNRCFGMPNALMLLMAAIVGFLVSLLAASPVFAGGDNGDGGIAAGPLVTANPFAVFEFLAEVAMYSFFIFILLNPGKVRITVSVAYRAMIRVVSPLIPSEEKSPRMS